MSGTSEEAAATGDGCMNKRRRVRAGAGSTVLPHLPLELVTTEILARLPVKSLLRFRSVCKAWRTVISGDLSLVSAHQQRQPRPSSLLIFPLLYCSRQDDDHIRYAAEKKEKKICGAMAFYQWELPLAGGGLVGRTAVTTISVVDDMPPEPHCRRVPHDALAHCDGLVLVATREGKVHLCNPAARQAVTLPWSPGSDPPRKHDHWHQAFGLGRDPRSGAYKAARFFRRFVQVPVVATGFREFTSGMEVFTVGVDRRWRELPAQPPHHPVLPLPVTGLTAASFKGSLLWTVVDEARNGAAPGFLRLSLEDETFGFTPAPPCHPRLRHDICVLSELRGELCLVRMVEPQPDCVLEMWMSEDAVHPRWERRYAIRVAPSTYLPRPVAVLDDGIVFHDEGSCHSDGSVCGYSFQTGEYKEIVKLARLRGYLHHRPGASISATAQVFAIPYRESLLQLNCVMA